MIWRDITIISRRWHMQDLFFFSRSIRVESFCVLYLYVCLFVIFVRSLFLLELVIRWSFLEFAQKIQLSSWNNTRENKNNNNNELNLHSIRTSFSAQKSFAFVEYCILYYHVFA